MITTTKMTQVTKFIVLAAMSVLPHVNAAGGRGKLYAQTAAGEPCNVYYEQQRGNECALHAVNCVLSSAGQNTITPEAMDKADGQSHGGNWGDDAVEMVLNQNGLSNLLIFSPNDYVQAFPSGEKPNATAWIINDTKNGIQSVHWHAYVKNNEGVWFDVESYRAGRTDENWCPRRVGDDAAMMQRIQGEKAVYPPRYIFRVGPLGAQQVSQVKSYSKPKPSTEGQWSCNLCYKKNGQNLSKCHYCEAPKPGSNSGFAQTGFLDAELQAAIAASLAPPSSTTTEVWKCKGCGQEQGETAFGCEKCGADDFCAA